MPRLLTETRRVIRRDASGELIEVLLGPRGGPGVHFVEDNPEGPEIRGVPDLKQRDSAPNGV